MNSPALRVVLLLSGDAEQLDKQGTQQTRVPIALVPLTAQAKILLRISTPGRSKGLLRATNPSTFLPKLSYLFSVRNVSHVSHIPAQRLNPARQLLRSSHTLDSPDVSNGRDPTYPPMGGREIWNGHNAHATSEKLTDLRHHYMISLVHKTATQILCCLMSESMSYYYVLFV